MFRPEKMSFVNVSVLDELLTQVLDRLTKLGVMHIVDKNELDYTKNELRDVNIQPYREEFTEFASRIQNLLVILEIESRYINISSLKNKESIQIDPLQIAEKIKRELLEIENKVNPEIQRRAQIQLEISELEENSHVLSGIEVQNVKVEDLRNAKFLYLAFGDIPVEYYHRLVTSLSHIPCLLAHGKVIAGRQQILAFSLMSEKEALSNALSAAYFTKTEISDKYHGLITEVLDEIEVEIWARREEMAEIEGEIRSLRKTWDNKLIELYSSVIANQVVLESMGKFGKTSKTYYLAGWVPYREVGKLEKELSDIAKEGILLEASEPIKTGESDHYNPKVPTKLNHPTFLRPFTGLVTNFGIPSYSGIDPTPIASIAFLAMFGIMFADVGHGLVLLVLGLLGALYPSPQLKPLRNLSIFLACCGVASIIFGFVFGSIFGKEEIIKPLWFSLENMKNPEAINRMLKFGIFFGVGIISLGVILNIIQSFGKKDYKNAIAGQWGIFSLIPYWVVIFMFITKTKFSWQIILILIILMLPIMLKVPFSRLIEKKHGHDEEEGESIIEAGFEIYEVVMAYLAHTLSYIRMAAFNLSHAGLMMASYALTQELGGGGNIFLSLPSNIMANIFVIILEGLVVAIQCMRLEYYEFFSKFFSGEGIEYKPLKIS